MNQKNVLPQPNPPVPHSIPLTRDWVAIIYPDNTITLQHISHAVMTGTGYVIDLPSIQFTDPAIQRQLDRVEEGRMLLRTLNLLPNGAVHCEPGGISMDGQIGPEGFNILNDTITSAGKYLRSLPQRQAGDKF